MSKLRDEYFEAQKQKAEIERFIASRLQTNYSEPVLGEPGLYRWIYGTTADDVIQNKKTNLAGCFWIHFDQKTISHRLVIISIRRGGKLAIENERTFMKLPADMLKFFDQRGFAIYHKNAEVTGQTITDWFDEEQMSYE